MMFSYEPSFSFIGVFYKLLFHLLRAHICTHFTAQNYELILKRQRKMCTFLFLVRVREDGDVFFDRAHALSWVMLPLRGLGSFYCNGVIVMACVAGITITALQ